MGAWQRILTAASAACALMCVLLALPMQALASDTESSMMFDDDQLIYVSQQHAIQVLQQMKNMGADEIKVSVYWGLIAPDSNSSHRPSFNAADPGDYPSQAWARYDLIDKEAAKLGIKVYFMLQGQAPVWARASLPLQGPPLSIMPKLSEWKAFVEAVGKRYSGSYVPGRESDTSSTPTQNPVSILGIPISLTPDSPTAGASAASTPLPRVSAWELWNEPNERGWLTPYRKQVGGQLRVTQPELYRSLANAAYNGLVATGHRGDTMLIGETANVGYVDPMPFLRDLYCVGGNDQPLRGRAAAAVFCPTTPNAAAFVSANPALFKTSGYAHHPYTFNVAPDRPYPNRTFVGLYNLSTMENTLLRTFSAYHVASPGGVPLYLTEWGYETHPPDPFVTTSLVDQETWLNQGEYMTWQDPYVKALAQFELVDNGPKAGNAPGTRGYWSTFQTGLEFSNGNQKPSFGAWEIPIWVPHPNAGPGVTVWGQLRPAVHTQVQYGLVQYSSSKSGSWTTLQEPQTTSAEGFLVTHVNIPGAGYLRLAWLDPFTGNVLYSRTVQIAG